MLKNSGGSPALLCIEPKRTIMRPEARLRLPFYSRPRAIDADQIVNEGVSVPHVRVTIT